MTSVSSIVLSLLSPGRRLIVLLRLSLISGELRIKNHFAPITNLMAESTII